MKKKLLFGFLIGLYFIGVAGIASALTLTHSQDMTIVPFTSIFCQSGGACTDNYWYRSFNLPSFGITDSFQITSVDIGIELAESPDGGPIPGLIDFFIDTTPGDPAPLADLIPLGSINAPVPNGADLTLLNFPGGPLVPAGSELVVSFITPDYLELAGFGALLIGANGLGETAPSYLAAPDCFAFEPVTIASLGYPDVHIIMAVNGDVAPIPEPTTMLLLGTGLVGVAGAARRKKKNQA